MPLSVIDRYLLKAVRNVVEPLGIRIELQSEILPELQDSSKKPFIRIADRRTLVSLLLNPELSFGDSYGEGRLEIDGDMITALENLCHPVSPIVRWSSRLVSAWQGWVQSNSLHGSRRNIRHHYDLPSDFYKLWLDPQMVYTCAYFPARTTTLEEAQRAKLDLVCRKLWLQPGERVVEAGCGWGALSLYMAKHYGVQVKAYNISHEQITFAREKAKEGGLSNEVEFIEEDYRQIQGRFDAFVSVGMLEHVGTEHYRELSRVIQGAIGDSGRGLLHFIGRNYPRPLSIWIRKRIFPGAYAPALREVMKIFEAPNYSVLDVENLRMHYARTLEHWLCRFEQSYDAVARRFGTEFARMWRLYLVGSIAAFNVGSLQLFQVVFGGRKCKQIPWTRNRLSEHAVGERPEAQQWIPAMS